MFEFEIALMSTEEKFELLVHALTVGLGREPTKEEIYWFIYGDQAMRNRIWNGEYNGS